VPKFRTGRVDSITLTRDGIQHLTVDGEAAYALTSVIGRVQVGDAVVMNTTAVELGLGTGGFHVVHWNLSRSRVDLGGNGHIMKGRYLSEQMNIEAWEESETAKLHRSGSPLPSLSGLTVITCLLHSHVGLLAAAIRSASKSASTAFVMTDWASLPLPLSNLIHGFSQLGLIDLTVSAGHAFGGDVEAVSVPSGLLAAAGRGVDIAIVGPGPGHVGTGTALGFSAIDAVGVVEVAGALGARTTCMPRWSSTDKRERHRGFSHHSATVMSLLGRPIPVPVPFGAVGDALMDELDQLDTPAEAVIIDDPVDVRAGFETLGVTVESMGRNLARDNAALAIAGATARWAVGS